MTFKQFKISVLLVLLSGTLFAQKFDKKFNEKFYTNKDVVVDIKASNAEIDVTTWNKNEVAVEAVIEVEGLNKEEAEKYLNNWNFEALGNKAKVQINASRSGFHSFGRNNFVMFNQHGNDFPTVIEVPEIDEDFIVLPEVEKIEIPEIDFDALVLPDLEELDFDFDKYAKDGDNYFIEWKDGVNSITIKSKKEWEDFKKSKEYKKFKKKQEKRQKELKEREKELKKVREDHRKELLRAREEQRRVIKEERAAMAKARAELKKINKKELREALAKAQKQLKNTRFSYSFSSDSNEFTVNGKKVKVTKRITIKVPNDATFDLNTRHCKIKLPKGKVNGKVSYGAFKADAINGGKLNVSYSPVTIESLNACTLFLNNVQDAKINSVANVILKSNASSINIERIVKNSELEDKFGILNINNVQKGFNKFILDLNSSEAKIKFIDLSKRLSTHFNKDGYRNYTGKQPKMFFGENTITSSGNFTIYTDDKNVNIKGKYSKIEIEK